MSLESSLPDPYESPHFLSFPGRVSFGPMRKYVPLALVEKGDRESRWGLGKQYAVLARHLVRMKKRKT